MPAQHPLFSTKNKGSAIIEALLSYRVDVGTELRGVRKDVLRRLDIRGLVFGRNVEQAADGQIDVVGGLVYAVMAEVYGGELQGGIRLSDVVSEGGQLLKRDALEVEPGGVPLIVALGNGRRRLGDAVVPSVAVDPGGAQ